MGYILLAVPCCLCGNHSIPTTYSEEMLLASLLLLGEVVGEIWRKCVHEYTAFGPYQNVDVDSGIASNQVLTLISDWCRY